MRPCTANGYSVWAAWMQSPASVIFFCEIEAKLRAVDLSDGRQFSLPLTQADLGEACGMTPVHINRMLKELRERGLMHMERGRVTILDLQALRRLSEFDASYLFINE